MSYEQNVHIAVISCYVSRIMSMYLCSYRARHTSLTVMCMIRSIQMILLQLWLLHMMEIMRLIRITFISSTTSYLPAGGEGWHATHFDSSVFLLSSYPIQSSRTALWCTCFCIRFALFFYIARRVLAFQSLKTQLYVFCMYMLCFSVVVEGLKCDLCSVYVLSHSVVSCIVLLVLLLCHVCCKEESKAVL
jgi:hypothetical protein